MKNKSPTRAIIVAESYDRCACFFPGLRRTLSRVTIGKRVIAVIAHKPLAVDWQERDAARCVPRQASARPSPQVVPSVSLRLEQSAPGAFWIDLAVNPDTGLQGAHATAPRTVAMAASLSPLFGQTFLDHAP